MFFLSTGYYCWIVSGTKLDWSGWIRDGMWGSAKLDFPCRGSLFHYYSMWLHYSCCSSSETLVLLENASSPLLVIKTFPPFFSNSKVYSCLSVCLNIGQFNPEYLESSILCYFYWLCHFPYCLNNCLTTHIQPQGGTKHLLGSTIYLFDCYTFLLAVDLYSVFTIPTVLF